MKKEILQKYARLIVYTGANVQKGQVVNIMAQVDQHEFATMVAEECYKAGAKIVNIDWGCEGCTRLKFEYVDEETLTTILPWEEAKMKQRVEDLPVSIYIESEDPDAMAGLDVSKISAAIQARSKVFKPYRNQIDGRFQWCIVAIPSLGWAKKIFPDVSDEEAMANLWDAVLTTVRIDEDNDPVAAWKEHVDFMTEKFNWLNEEKFDKLHYSSANGTDFTVKLNPIARWAAANETNPENGAIYIPNMPTEEVFTSPMAGDCDGTVVATKTLSYNGTLIENFSITFKDGKAVSWKAEKGEEMLGNIINMDERACMLGEVALVPKESPVNGCGFLFHNTLFDENACCHLALGMGFKDLLPDGVNLTVEEAMEKGCNDSITHVDFMIGSEDLSIVGIKEDGTEVPVFVNGTWA